MNKSLFCAALFATIASLIDANGVGVVGSAAKHNVSLHENTVKIVALPAGGQLLLQATSIPEWVTYIVCQAHTQKGSIILSMTAEQEYSTSAVGKDVGVITVMDGQMNVSWYLFSNTTKDANVLVHLTFLKHDDPLPGGCNEEFRLENDSNIHLYVQSTKTRVNFQRSRAGYDSSIPAPPGCENEVYQSYLSYHSYVHYIQGGDFTEQTYFNRLQEVLTAARTFKYGTWLKQITSKVKSFFDISSYHRQGVIYNVIVKKDIPHHNVHTVAAYVPVVTYDCDIDDPSDCEHRDIAAVIITSVCGILGFFLCFFGHRFFKTEIFVFGFTMFAVVFYQVLCLCSQMTFPGIVTMTVILGVVGGGILLALWWYCGVPILSVVFISLVFGYMVSSILFYTPLANLSYWANPFNYGATFGCGVLILPVFMLFFTRTLNIVSCAVVGTYAIIFALDTYTGGGMRNILINSVRHGTDKDYVKVIVTGPFTGNEIALTVVWIVLCAAGIGIQLFRERKKAPFPPSPRQLHDRDRDLRRLLRAPNVSASPDREPLLRGDNQRQYGTTEANETQEETESRPGMV